MRFKVDGVNRRRNLGHWPLLGVTDARAAAATVLDRADARLDPDHGDLDIPKRQNALIERCNFEEGLHAMPLDARLNPDEERQAIAVEEQVIAAEERRARAIAAGEVVPFPIPNRR